MRPEINAKNKIKALERRKALLDALIVFVQTHPDISSEAVLKPLSNRTGLYFEDCALIKPMWDERKGKVELRLEKYSEDLSYSEDYDPLDSKSRTVCDDVTDMPEKKLEKILDKLNKEIHSDDEEQ